MSVGFWGGGRKVKSEIRIELQKVDIMDYDSSGSGIRNIGGMFFDESYKRVSDKNYNTCRKYGNLLLFR